MDARVKHGHDVLLRPQSRVLAEMLRQLEPLRLVVGADPLAIQARRRLAQLFIDPAPEGRLPLQYLAILLCAISTRVNQKRCYYVRTKAQNILPRVAKDLLK